MFSVHTPPFLHGLGSHLLSTEDTIYTLLGKICKTMQVTLKAIEIYPDVH